jgi:hypothetical protein
LLAFVNPVLKGGPHNDIYATASHDFENGRRRWDGELAARLIFRVRQIEMGGVISARCQHIDAVPVAFRVGYTHGAPSL